MISFMGTPVGETGKLCMVDGRKHKMHTWTKKGIALAVSGVLTIGMAASLPFSSFAESAGENVIFQAECEDLDGATM